MPSVSQRQRGWVYANKGAAWAKEHHFDNKGKLPDRKAANARAAKRRLRKKHRKPGY